MHGEPLQCENVLSGCDFHTQSRSTLVKHERYFCEFREVMQVEEDKYFEKPKEHNINIYLQHLFFNKKGFCMPHNHVYN